MNARRLASGRRFVNARGRRVPPLLARHALLLILVLPAAVSVCLLAPHQLRNEPTLETRCWILPHLRILPAPGELDCPLTPRDAIRGVAEREGRRTSSITDPAGLREALTGGRSGRLAVVERDGRRLTVELPSATTSRLDRALRMGSAAAVALLLLAIPFALIRGTSAPAALPLALFYGAFSVVIVTSIAGRSSASASVAGVASLVLAPAPLFHLAFLFPRRRRIALEVPAIVWSPYVLSVLPLALGALALWRTPLLWPAFLQLLVVVAAAAWGVLISACVFAVRESDSAIERARAKIVLLGALVLPAAPTAVGALHGSATGGEIAVLYLWSAAAVLPLPIALGISRYNLFDLGLDSRQGVARALYVVLATFVLAGVAWLASSAVGERNALPSPSSLLAVCFVCVLALEPVRSRMPRLLESLVLPRLHALRTVRTRLERRLPGLDDEDEILAFIQEAVVDGISGASGAVFLTGGGPARLVHAFGDSPASRGRLADTARAALGMQPFLHLPGVSGSPAEIAALRRARVALVVPIESGDEALGLLLVGPPASRAFYTGIEIDFVRAICSVVGAALHRVRASALRQVREREAATGRIALALAQDTGKDIGWLRMLSERLARCPDGSDRARRDAATIAEISEELFSTFGRILEEASRGSSGGLDLPRFDDVVERTTRRLASLHGVGRIVGNVDPSLREVRAPEYVGRVLGNVLDNALHASPDHELVHLFATLDGDRIRVSIEDRGCGIPRELGDSVFEPGVGSRKSEGGAGMGLTVAKETLETVGGTIELGRRHGGGTVATIGLPRRFEGRAEAG